MRRCKNGRIIPFLEAKMGFDSGPGIMYKSQALLLCQVIGKLPLTDAELVIKHASSRSYALFDYFKPAFIKSAQEQGYSFLHATNEWYRTAFQAVLYENLFIYSENKGDCQEFLHIFGM